MMAGFIYFAIPIAMPICSIHYSKLAAASLQLSTATIDAPN